MALDSSLFYFFLLVGLCGSLTNFYGILFSETLLVTHVTNRLLSLFLLLGDPVYLL